MDKSDYKFGEEIIKDELFTVDSVYVDIDFLKYTKIGPILAHKDLTPDQYTGMLNIIKDPQFVKRYTDDPQILFKDVKGIDSLVNNPDRKSTDVLFSISPAFVGGVETVRNCLRLTNKTKLITKSDVPTTVTVDVSSQEGLSDSICTALCAEYKILFDTDVNLIREKPVRSQPSPFIDYDIFYVSDIARFNAVAIDDLNAGKFFLKHFVCSKLLPLSKLEKVTSENIDTLLLNLEFIMSASSNFHFIAPFAVLVR